MIDHAIAALADYGVRTGLIEPADRVWAVNRLLEVMELSDYQEPGGALRRGAAGGNSQGTAGRRGGPGRY